MHRHWSDDDLAKFRRMAGKYPPTRIAAELGRGIPAIRVKAHELRISLRVKREDGPASAGPAAASARRSTHLSGQPTNWSSRIVASKITAR